MRVLVAFSLTNGKTQPYKSTSPPVKMRTGPCARLPRDLGSALSEPARLSLGLKHRSTSWNGSSDPRRHTALLSTAQRLLLPPAAATPTVTASTSMGYGVKAPGRVRSNFVGNTVVFISISGSYCCPHLHHLLGISHRLPCTSHQLREALLCGMGQVGCVIFHCQTGRLDSPANPHHISYLPSPARQGADDCCPPPEPLSTHMRMTAGLESSSPISR